MASACGWGLVTAVAQERPPVTVRDAPAFAEVMGGIGEDWAILDEAIAGPTYLLNSVRGDGITRLDRIAAGLDGARRFLVTHSRTGAAGEAAAALRAVAALREELIRAEPDQAAAQEETGHVRAACASCHQRYREGDATTGYRFKPGVLD